MQRFYIRFTIILLVISLLASCNAQVGFTDAPVEESPDELASGTEPVIVNGSENLSYTNQDVASAAHQNMLAYFGWDFSIEDIDKMPDDYGGCYINERNVFTVNVVNPDDESIALYEKACKEPIEIVSVTYTMKELYEASDALMQYRTDGKLEIYSFGIDEKNNRIPITLLNEEAADAAKILLADYPCVEISIADASLTLSQYGNTPSDDEVVIVPEFPVYDPGMDYIDFTMQNNGRNQLTFGAGDYEIEVYLDGAWYSIPMKPGMAFISIGYILNPNSHRYRRANLSFFNYSFTPGKYRVVQKFGEHIYFGEFELGKSNVTAKTPYGFVPLEELPKNYTIEMAKADGCIITGDDETYDLIKKFLDKTYGSMPAMIRIASKTLLGGVIITDIEFKGHQNGPGASAFYFIQDNSRDKLSLSKGITKKIYSFLNYHEKDSGFEILLSNYPSIQQAENNYDRQTILNIKAVDEFSEIAELCKQIEEKYSMSSSVKYVIYSESGVYSAGLYDEPLQFGVQKADQNGRRGELFDLPEGMADEITDLKWISEGRLKLIGTVDGKQNSEIAIFNAALWDYEKQ